MGRHSKQKRHLIHLNSLQGSAAEQSSDPNTLAHYVQCSPIKSTIAESFSSEESENSSSSESEEEIIWADAELDNKPEITVEKLFRGTKNMKSSKRPFRYNGNGIR